MDNRYLYTYILAVVFLALGILGWVSRDTTLTGSQHWWGYGSALVGALLLAYAIWSTWGELKGSVQQRTTRTGAQVLAMIVIVTGMLTVVELISVNHYTRWDVTPGKFFSLSPKSIQLLEKIDREKKKIEVLAFMQKSSQAALDEILDQYAQRTKQVSYRLVDLDANPAIAKKYDVDAYGTFVIVHHLEKDREKGKGKSSGAQSADKDRKEKKNFRSEKIYDLSENAIANAILKTTQTEQKKVYFLTGHGERQYVGQSRGSLRGLSVGLRDENYAVKDLLLLREKGVPPDSSLIIIAAPKTDLDEKESKAIEEYLNKGGKLLVLVEPDTSAKRLFDLLAKYGFEVPDSIVVDPSSVRFALVGGNEVTPFVVDYGLHKITEKLKGLATVFPTVRKVSAKNDPDRGLSAETIGRTGKGSYTVKPLIKNNELTVDTNSKKDGPVPIGAAVRVKLETFTGKAVKKNGNSVPEARIVVFGDADFASDAYIGAQGNSNLVFNTVNWLSGEEDLITIRPKARVATPMLIGAGEGAFVQLFALGLMPLLIILSGAAVYIRRRKLR